MAAVTVPLIQGIQSKSAMGMTDESIQSARASTARANVLGKLLHGSFDAIQLQKFARIKSKLNSSSRMKSQSERKWKGHKRNRSDVVLSA